MPSLYSIPIEQKLTASDGSSGDFFGVSIAILDNLTVVGAPHGDYGGGVYIYDSAKSPDVFGYETKLTASDSSAAIAAFGSSVAISSNYLVVGANLEGGRYAYSGSVYVYDLTKSPNEANYETKIKASDEIDNARFGGSVAISGSLIAVGAFYDAEPHHLSYGPGSAYIYDLAKTPEETGYETKLKASDRDLDDNFGFSVDISNDRVVVGAPRDDDNGTSSGSLYVYDLTKNPSELGYETKITASDGAAGDSFGYQVRISGDLVFAGSRNVDDNGTNSGSVYIYDLTKNSGDDGYETKLQSSDSNAGDNFGVSIAISNNQLVVGAYGDENYYGSAYVYDLTKQVGESDYEIKLKASDGNAEDLFGGRVAVSGNRVAVSAYRSDGNGADTGSAYLYEISRSSDSYTVTFKLDEFGIWTGGSELIQTISEGSAIEPTFSVVPGKFFTGWDVSFDNISSDTTVTAQYVDDIDTDGDGLIYSVEYSAGTDPNLADTDGDLIFDNLEIDIGTDPLVKGVIEESLALSIADGIRSDISKQTTHNLYDPTVVKLDSATQSTIGLYPEDSIRDIWVNTPIVKVNYEESKLTLYLQLQYTDKLDDTPWLNIGPVVEWTDTISDDKKAFYRLNVSGTNTDL